MKFLAKTTAGLLLNLQKKIKCKTALRRLKITMRQALKQKF